MGGGAEKILSNILNNIDLCKYVIDVLEYVNFGIKKESVPDKINLLPPLITMDNKMDDLAKIILDKAVYSYPSLVRFLTNRKKYDIEISFNVLIPSFLLNKKTKTICWVHGDVFFFNDYQYRSFYEKQNKVFLGCNSIVSISSFTSKSIKEMFPNVSNKIKTIYNGFDFEDIDLKKDEQTAQYIHKNSLILVGRLDENKNPELAIEFIEKLHLQGKKYHLYVLGDGCLKERCMIKAIEKSLEDYIHFFGYVQNPYPYMKKAKAIISFSGSEGFPTVIVESMYLGKPFISFNVGGIEELSSNGKYGIVVKDVNEAVKEIYKIEIGFFNEDELNKHACQFSLGNQISEIENLLDNL